MIHHITRVSRHLVFWTLLTVAVGLTGLRLVLSGIDSYKAYLAEHISELVGSPVSIGQLRAKMRGFNPELVLADIAVRPQAPSKESPVALREVRIGLNLLGMLASHDLLSSAWLTLVGAKFSVYRKDDGSFAIVGLRAGGEQPNWLWQGRKFEILQSEVVWNEHPNQQHPITLQAVDLAIINDGQQHRVNFLAKLPDYYGQALLGSVDFTGDPFTAGAVAGKAFIEARQIKVGSRPFNGLAKAHGFMVASGYANLRVWSRLQHSQLAAVTGEVGLHDLKLSRQDQGLFALDSIQTAFAWRQDPSNRDWQLDVTHLSIKTDGKHPADGVFRLSGQQPDNNYEVQKIAAYIGLLDVQHALRTVQFFAPEGKLAVPIPGYAKGTLGKLSLLANIKDGTAAINGDFNNLSTAPVASIPGVDNLSGHIQGTHKTGRVALATHNAHITLPSLFREALVIKRLQGHLHWRQQDTAWELSSRGMAMDLLGVQTLSRVQFIVPKHLGSPFLDLQTALECDDASQLKHYFPVGVMRPADIAWLDRAFVQGQIHNGQLVYISKLGQPLASHVRDFEAGEATKPPQKPAVQALPPEADALAAESREPMGGGFFEALMDVEHLQLDYAPSWPQITDIKGKLRFLQGRMVVSADEGSSNHLKASKVTVINPAVGVSPKLLVQGLVDGEITDALEFLKNTPLRDRIGMVADAISTKGATQVSLDLVVPLAYGVLPKVDGEATLDQASLKVLSLDLPVNRIRGLLKFNEHGIYSDTIKAVALKHPVQIKIASKDGQTTLQAEGHAKLVDLERQFNLPHTDIADGGLDYHLTFRLPLDDKPSDLVIESDLAGVELALPGLLSKPRDGQQAFKVVFGLNDKLSMPIAVNYGNELKAALQFETATQRIVSGHILFGEGEAIAQRQPGLKLEINRKQLDLKDALSWTAGGQGQNGGPAIREINLHSGHASWAHTPLGAFDLTLKPDGKQWLGHLNSVFAVGELHAPMVATPESTVRLDMSLLDLSVIKHLHGQGNDPETPLLPQSLPSLVMGSEKTLWQSLDLGKLTLETEHVPDGMAIKTMQLDGAAQKLQLSGDWTVKNQQPQTQLRGHLEMPNAGRTLAQLDISHDLADTDATVDFSGHWRGAPHQFSMAGVKGDVDLSFSEGRILSIEPGFGRVLGILAMEQWVKRLQLDFRDLYEEGLAFNSIKGHFTLSDGKAMTRDLRVDAIPARITITGTTDFISKTLDQQANVIPKSADALPIAGTIVDKFTSLVMHTLTGDDQDGFLLGSQYQLKGQWASVQVIPQHDNDGVVPKIWSGLTDFSWLGQADNNNPNKQ